MYNNTRYEDYMRNVLGYLPNSCMQDTYQSNNCHGMPDNNFQRNNELDNLYPDIYKVVYPLVCNECNMNSMPITEECIDKMIDNVYRNIEVDLKLNTNMNVEFKKDCNRNMNSRQGENKETRQQRDNSFLRDLIRILILRELLQRGNRPGQRPIFSGGSRPPFLSQRPIMQKEF